MYMFVFPHAENKRKKNVKPKSSCSYSGNNGVRRNICKNYAKRSRMRSVKR